MVFSILNNTFNNQWFVSHYWLLLIIKCKCPSKYCFERKFGTVYMYYVKKDAWSQISSGTAKEQLRKDLENQSLCTHAFYCTNQ